MPLSVSSWWDSLASGLGTRLVVRWNDQQTLSWRLSHLCFSVSWTTSFSHCKQHACEGVIFNQPLTPNPVEVKSGWTALNKTQSAPEQNHQLGKFQVFSTTVVKICEVNCLISLGEYWHMCIFSSGTAGVSLTRVLHENCSTLFSPPFVLCCEMGTHCTCSYRRNGHTLYM